MTEDTTRRGLLAAGGMGAAALALAACGGSDDDGSAAVATVPVIAGEGDVKILNYAVLLEYLETDFYGQVVQSDILTGKARELATRFWANEQEHVDALTGGVRNLGGTPPVKPKTKFELKDPASVLQLAATIEQIGAQAYLGQAAAIKDPSVLRSALAIHSVEARHAAALNILLGKPPVTDGAFAKGLPMDVVLKSITPFLEASS